MTDNDSVHGPPNFPGYPESYGSSGKDIARHQQAIITSYNFECCGNITEWGVDVNPGISYGDECTLDQRVWTPSLTVKGSNGTSSYNLVRKYNNRAISDTIVSPWVAIVTPSPQEFMPFHPGDVLGMCVEEASRKFNNDSEVMLTENGFTTKFASIAPNMATSLNGSSVWKNEVLNSSTNAAPVISEVSGTYSSVHHQLAPQYY